MKWDQLWQEAQVPSEADCMRSNMAVWKEHGEQTDLVSPSSTQELGL